MNTSSLRKTLMLIMALPMGIGASLGLAQAPSPVPNPLEAGTCPEPLVPPKFLLEAIAGGTVDRLLASPPPELKAFDAERTRRSMADWADLCRYRDANAVLARQPGPAERVVFLGDSITENWATLRPGFIDNRTFIGRGIGGQVSGQALLRFQQDVVGLHPAYVHIMIGTNDLAGAQMPIRFAAIQDNIASMVQLARSAGITPILASVPPATRFVFPVPGDAPPKVIHLNDWIRQYAAQNHVVHVDYFKVLAAPDGTLRKELTTDGIHPNPAGYALMEPIAMSALNDARRARLPSN